MNSEAWLEILRRHVAEKGQAAVAREIGYSPAVVSQVLSGNYLGNVEKVCARIERIYGRDGQVQCPELGLIAPSLCVDVWERAQRVGLRAGNPRTVKLHKTCRGCAVRR